MRKEKPIASAMMRSRVSPFLLLIALAAVLEIVYTNQKASAEDLNRKAPRSDPRILLPDSLIEGNPAFRIFTDKDGLPQNAAMDVAFDHRGYLWVGTQNGAAYYNGRRWTAVNMPNRRSSNFIHDILAASDGSLWFATNGGGLSQLKEGKWNTYVQKSGALPSDIVNKIVETKSSNGRSTIWAGTRNGLARFDAEGWRTYNRDNSGLPNNDIWSLAPSGKENDGGLWVGTNGGGLARFDESAAEASRWIVYDAKTSPAPSNNIWVLTESFSEKGGRAVWIGTEEGLARLEETSDSKPQWDVYNAKNSPLPNNVVRALLECRSGDGNRSLWIGTEGGLARLDNVSNSKLQTGNSAQWTLYNKQNSDLPQNTIRSIQATDAKDGCRALWVGTNGGGLVRLEPNGWTTFSVKSSGLPDNNVRCMLEIRSPSGSAYMFGTTGGLARFENGRWTVYDSSNSALPDNNVETLLESASAEGRKRIWAGTHGGLVLIEDGKWKIYNAENSGLPSNHVMCLYETASKDGSRKLWAGTWNGLACFKNGEWIVYDTNNSALPHNRVETILQTVSAEGRSRLWVGTWGGGLTRIDDIENLELRNGASLKEAAQNADSAHSIQWKVYNTENSRLPNNVVKCLRVTDAANDRCSLWVGTNGGFVRFDPDNENEAWFELTDSTTPALPDTVVTQILEDAQKRIYVFTFKGISRMTRRISEHNNSSEYDFYTFTIEDGLPGNGINPRAAMLDSAGRIWAGTLYGVAMLDPNRTVEDRTPKSLCIERALVNAKAAVPNRNGLQELDHSLRAELGGNWLNGESLAYDQNNIIFEYALLNYFKESDTQYRVQLEGFEKIPSEWSADYRKEYTNLGEGKYVFKVWGRDGAGNISKPSSIAFSIRPAPWLSWWAFLLYFSLVGGFVYAGYEWRIRAVTHRQREYAERMRSLQEQRIENLHQMLKSIQIINSQLDLDTALLKIAAEGACLIGGEQGSIGLIDGDKLVFKQIWFKDKLEKNPIIFPLGQGIAGKTAVDGKARIVNDPVSEPGIIFPELVEKYVPHGFINVPIIDRNGKVVGVLDVHRPEGRAPFTEADAQLLEVFTHQAAVAIENAFLYGALEEKNFTLQDKNLFIAQSLIEIETLYQKEQQITRTLQELNRMKTNFMVVTSHEMRTPLSVLRGYHELLLDGVMGEITAEQKRSLAACQRAIDHMIENIETISEMLKISEGRVEVRYADTNLTAMAREAITELAPFIDQRKQKIDFEGPEDLCLSADPDKVKAILINILQNAIKFSRDEGLIRMRIEAQDGSVLITITDSGIGIAPSEIERIFDKFYTQSDPSRHTSGKFEFAARGTGLGLAIAKSYVEAHGGRIWAVSEGLDKGSSFHIALPLGQDF